MSKKTASLALVLALAGSSLVACGSSSSDVPQPKSSSASAHAAASAEQFDPVRTKILDSIAKADKELNPEDLSARTTGPFTKIRTAQYQLKTILGDGYTLNGLSDSAVSTVSTGSASFPRYALSEMNAASGSSSPSVQLYTQAQVRENWKLWGSLDILEKMPKLDAGDTGMEIVDPDSNEGLVASPKQAVSAYVQLNNTHTDSQGLTFADDKLRPQLKEAHDSNASTVNGVGEAFMSFAAPEDQLVAFRTSDGGALVFSAFDYNTEVRVTAAGGKIKIGGTGGALAAGSAGEQVEVSGTLVQNFSSTIGMYVPPAGAEDASIKLVAASQPAVVSVSNG